MLVNKVWENTLGGPYNYAWGNSILDNSGNLLTTGHTTIDSLNTELIVAKLNPQGTILWQSTFQVNSNSKNGGVVLTADSNNNIYIGGVYSTSDDISDFDFLIVKYNSTGTKLWHKVYDGTGSGMDVPTSIIATSAGLFVSGASEGVHTGLDFWSMKLSTSTGSINWQKRYDYSGLDDYPVSMLEASGNIIVTGSSAETALNWEIATLKYSAASGLLLGAERIGNDSLGFSQPSGIVKTHGGNFIVSGITTSNGINYDIRTVKLDSNLDLVWTKDYDSGANLDSISTLTSTTAGNVVLTGWKSNAYGGREMLTLLYKPDGSLGWVNQRTLAKSSNISMSRAMTIDGDDNVTIVGSEENKLVITQYGPTGVVSWERIITNSAINTNTPLNIIQDNDGFYITSIVDAQEGRFYANYKLETYRKPYVEVVDTSGNPLYVENEVIVRFNQGAIKNSFINNKGMEYEALGGIFDDATCLREIQKILGTTDVSNWIASKIYKGMTMADSNAVTSMGKTIHVPDFYNTLLLHIPDNYDRIIGEIAIRDTLDSDSLGCCVLFAEVNRIFTLDECNPDDPLYSTQASLQSTTQHPNANINVEEAWCISTGSSDIKISIVDSGIRWSHEDFGDGTFEGSVIVGGKNYETGQEVFANPDNDVLGHGTQVASIPGAIRNNNKGIAGIAGGSGSMDGVRLVAQNIRPLTAARIVEAFEDAVNEYGAQIINMSGGYWPDQLPEDDQYTDDLREIMHFLNRMGVVICASRGNGFGSDYPRYPCSIQDEWVICVGCTGTDGQWNSNCNIGGGIDIAGPSSYEIAKSIQNTSDQAYGGISNSSSATPHVTGVAALLLGHAQSIGIQLTPDDVEGLIQASATNVGNSATDYDEETGHGRLNAGKALSLLDGPSCDLYQFGTETNAHTRSIELVEENVDLVLLEKYFTESGEEFSEGVSYSADVYKVTVDVSHSLSAGHGIRNIWSRNSTSTTLGLYEESDFPFAPNTLLPVEQVNIIGTPTETAATLEGYVYHLETLGCPDDSGWIPAPPEDAVLNYSIVGCILSSTDEIEKESLKVYPNPTTGELIIELPLDIKVGYTSLLEVYDFSGRKVKSVRFPETQHKMTINVEALPAGMYTCILSNGNVIYPTQFVKL